MDGGGEAISQRLRAGEDAPGEGQLADHVGARQLAHQGDARHVGNEAPLDLEDRQPRVGRDIADVRAERDLKAAAERDAVDRRDHGNRDVPPDSAACWGALAIPWVRVTRSERAASRAAARHRREPRLVQTRAKSAPGARKDDGAQAGLAPQPLARRDDRLEHRGIERVELVRSIEPDLGDAAGDVDQNAVARRGQGFVLMGRSRVFPQRPNRVRGTGQSSPKQSALISAAGRPAPRRYRSRPLR